MRDPALRVEFDDEIVADGFAGGGGASEGIANAIGRSPDIAINHDAEAIACHMANHPDSTHYHQDVWEVDPVVVCAGRPVGIVRHGHYSTLTGAGIDEGKGCGTFRGQQLALPLATVCATNDKHLVCPIITKHYTGVIGHGLGRPLGTVTAIDHHALTEAELARDEEPNEEVVAFLTKYYGTGGQQQSLLDPLHTVTSKARFALVTVHGVAYRIVDIRMRMLVPRELFRANAFPDSYIIDPLFNGKPLTITTQTRLAGNSVSPVMARALIEANRRTRSARAA